MQNTRDPMGFVHDLDRLTINLEDLPQAHLAQAEAYQRVRVQLRGRDDEIANLKQLIQNLNQKASDQTDNIINMSSNRQYDKLNLAMQVLLLEAKLDGRDIQLASMEVDLKETERSLEKTKDELQSVKEELESEDTHSSIIESHLARALQEKFKLTTRVKDLCNVQKENEEQHEYVYSLTQKLQTERGESNRLSMKVKAMRNVYKNNTELHDRLKTLTKALQEEQGETTRLSEVNKALLTLQAQFTEALESDNEEETSNLRAKLAESKMLYSQLQSRNEELVRQLQKAKNENSELKDNLADCKEASSKLQHTIHIYACQVSKGSIKHNEDRIRRLQLENTVLRLEIIIEQLNRTNKGCTDELSRAHNTLEREATAYSALEKQNNTLLGDAIAHEETISTLRLDFTKAEEKIKWYELHQESVMAANTALNEKLKTLAAQHETLNEQCDSQIREILSNRHTIVALRKNSVTNDVYQAVVSEKQLLAEENVQLKDRVQELENTVRDAAADTEMKHQTASFRNEEQVEEIKELRSQVQELEDAAADTHRDMENMLSNISYWERQIMTVGKARDLLGAQNDKLKEELEHIRDSGCRLARKLIHKKELIIGLKYALNNIQGEKIELGKRNITLERTNANLNWTLQNKVEEGRAQTERLVGEKAAFEREFATAKMKLEMTVRKARAHADLLEDDNSLLQQRMTRMVKEQKDRTKRENEWNSMVQCELDKIKIDLRAENNAYKERVAKLEARYEDRSWEFEGSDLESLKEAGDVCDTQLSDAKREEDVRDVQLSDAKVEGDAEDEVSSGPEVESASDDDEVSGPDVESASEDDESALGLESASDNSVV